MNKTIENTRKYLKNLFKNDKRAWVVAYSGGKDSTLVLQLVVELLHELDKSIELLPNKQQTQYNVFL